MIPCYFSQRNAMVTALAERVIGTVEAGLASRGEAGLILSGGSTPVPLFQKLAEMPCAWARVRVGLADERWVPTEHVESNQRLVREHLQRKLAAKLHLVGLKTEAETPELGCAEAEQRLAAIPFPYDMVILGMGNDGHTASLFPGGDHLLEGLDPDSLRACVPMRAPGIPQARISLTLARLLCTRELVLMITGRDKRTLLEKALRPGPVAELPIRAVLRQQRVPVHCYWAP